ncbi:hypothetical protein [Butyrivibrio sp. XBB1001]|uniref:hypothetical protein n=1 Tax=Butyrivibrio sp. XBB1001 TaxID=1280682 RepID=UPI00042A42C2|nr:hypothetical protein [Butyrivibrio sp. XBB1001]
MKTISKVMYALLGIIIALCLIILISAFSPPFAKALYGIRDAFSNNEAEVAHSSEEASDIDIDSLLAQIEGHEEEPSELVDNKDLGLIDENIYHSLDDYYNKLIEVIRDEYHKGTTIAFKLNISEDVFTEWYKTNFINQSNNHADSNFDYSVSYEKTDDFYIINHVVTFK